MIEFIIVAVCFFFLGRYTKMDQKIVKDSGDKLGKHLDRMLDHVMSPHKTKIKPGVIPFKTPDQFEREKNGDAALEKRWRESGIAKEIQQ